MKYTGKSIVQGIAIGKIAILNKEERKECSAANNDAVMNPDAEITRLQNAIESVTQGLTKLIEEKKDSVGEKEIAIIQGQIVILEDPELFEAICKEVRETHCGLESAITNVKEQYREMFSQMDDEYFKARFADLEDAIVGLLEELQGDEDDRRILEEPTIVVSKDISPSMLLRIKNENLAGIALEAGSSISHVAILAKAMDIPMVISVGKLECSEKEPAVLDAEEGKLLIGLTEEETEWYKNKKHKMEKEQKELQSYIGLENKTRDGRGISICANAGSAAEVSLVKENDADGIGLYRSEYDYLQAKDYPTEEELFESYKAVAEQMAPKKVVIRTIDIGADKGADYLGLAKEENPAMGNRAIRICLQRPELFKTQLRAIYRASSYGNVSIMFPMIVSVEEIKQIKRLIEEVKELLRKEGASIKDVELGVMIETPAAAIISDLLAKEVDFFSIGTNDLTQYTLAMDRQNESLSSIYNSHHPAILRLIKMVVENGHKEGCHVGICGELASDLELTETFLDYGVDELSVSPSMVLRIRDKIRKI